MWPKVASPCCSFTNGEDWFVAYLISFCSPVFLSKCSKACFDVCLLGIVNVIGDLLEFNMYVLSFISQLGLAGCVFVGAFATTSCWGATSTFFAGAFFLQP